MAHGDVHVGMRDRASALLCRHLFYGQCRSRTPAELVPIGTACLPSSVLIIIEGECGLL